MSQYQHLCIIIYLPEKVTLKIRSPLIKWTRFHSTEYDAIFLGHQVQEYVDLSIFKDFRSYENVNEELKTTQKSDNRKSMEGYQNLQ